MKPEIHNEYLSELYSKIHNKVNNGIIILDNNLNIISFNKTAMQITNLTHKEVSNKTLDSFKHLKNLSKLARISFKSKSHTKKQNIDIKTNKGINDIPLSASTEIIIDKKNIKAIVIIFEDLSVINNLQKQITKIEKVSAMGKMTTWLIHELRTPMNVIRDLAEIILIKNFNEKKIKQYMSIIISQIDRLNFLIQGITEFFTPKKPHLSKINICQTVDNLVEVYKETFSLNTHHQISFSFICDKQKLYVMFDKDQLQQILFNLIKNSIDSINIKGSVIIQIEEKKDFINLSIKDNGCGMTPKTKKSAFNAFFTTKTHGQGSGLGLAIVKSIVEKHGYKIKVSSNSSKGTTVTIIINKIF